MTSLSDFSDYLEHIKGKVPAIKTTRLVVDDSQISDILKDLKQENNLILMGLIPDHVVGGTNQGDAQYNETMGFMILKKSNRAMKHSDFLDVMQECQSAAKAIVEQMRLDIEDYNDGCSFLNQLNFPGLSVKPVWGFNGTDGYDIIFSTKSGI